ncbi:hypothetical protein MKW98_021467 [Papaver atlanticum]|uniref:Bifunctional inhibitor/plant lipid transfer protein/seed storage helical domain-containing protein n=1 Tax=Papaver atlanticum TaxID=357466 RepID=A0AAD4XIU1_9MAGN|nr:hypothetical protein MKW98_021467 [Papaver atlanticum]
MAIGILLIKCMFLMGLSVGFCSTQLVGISTCLSYVSGTGKSPTPDCCTGLKKVVATSMKCVCVLIRDRNDPSLGLKIDTTLALGLPSICKTTNKISEWFLPMMESALLNLPPNSTDAKMFKDFDSVANGNGTTTTASASKEIPTAASSPQVKNDGGLRINNWLGLKMVCGFILWCLTS